MRALRLLLPLALLTACGPTEREAGQAVLFVAPFLTLVGALLADLYRRAWKPLIEDLEFRYWPSLMATIVQSTLLLGIMFHPQLESEWVLMALWAVGSSYLSLQLIGMRMTLLRGLRKHYTWVALGPWLILYLPALFLGMLGSTSEETGAVATFVWVIPGYAGLATAPIFLVLGGELAVRRYRHHQRRKAARPEPLPRARARIVEDD